MSRIAHVNGEFVPLSEARVSVLDRGFLFADGVYEVTCVFDGELVDYDGHAARLERSLSEIGMKMPMSHEAMHDLHRQMIERNGLVEGGVYLEVTRGAADDRDFVFPKDARQTVVLFTQARDLAGAPAAKTGIKAKSVPDIRWLRRDIKSVALLAQVLAKQAAAEAGANEAIMHEDGVVTEGGSSNAWIVTEGGEVVTRNLSSSILAGITRKSVKKLAEDSQIRVVERPFTLDEARKAREMFVTAATTLVMPVTTFDDAPVGDGRPGPVAARLRELYIAAGREEAARRKAERERSGGKA
ncbi:MAG: D-amino-acid transaminase [Flavobacteriaceae bacterium]